MWLSPPTAWFDWLFAYEIRRYQPHASVWENWACWFNLLEAVAWFVIAGLVLRRWLRFHRSGEELIYAAAFLTFGLTDVREAFVLETWLLWVKGLNLLVILWLRSRLLKHHYPEWKTY